MKQNSNRTVLTLLLLICLFHCIRSVQWLETREWPQGKDYAYHLQNAVSEIGREGTLRQKLFTYSNRQYPPVYYLSTVILYDITGSYRLILLNSTLFLLILILATYGAGTVIFDKETAVVSALLVSMFPGVYAASRQFNLELATGAVAALSVYVLLLSGGFKVRRYSLLFGAVLSAALLTRQLAMSFIIGPVLVMLGQGMKRGSAPAERLNIIKNFLLALAICCAGVFFYYYDGIAFETLLSRWRDAGAIDSPRIFSFQHLFFYPLAFWQQIGWFTTLFFIPGFIRLMISPDKNRRLLIAWIVFPLLIQTLVIAKYPSYIIGMLPAAALTVGFFIHCLPAGFPRKAAALTLVIVNLSLYFQNF